MVQFSNFFRQIENVPLMKFETFVLVTFLCYCGSTQRKPDHAYIFYPTKPLDLFREIQID